jgi:hypothetical protein
MSRRNILDAQIDMYVCMLIVKLVVALTAFTTSMEERERRYSFLSRTPHETKDSHMKLFFAGATHASQIRVREQIRMTLKTPLEAQFRNEWIIDIRRNIVVCFAILSILIL